MTEKETQNNLGQELINDTYNLEQLSLDPEYVHSYRDKLQTYVSMVEGLNDIIKYLADQINNGNTRNK